MLISIVGDYAGFFFHGVRCDYLLRNDLKAYIPSVRIDQGSLTRTHYLCNDFSQPKWNTKLFVL